MLLPYQKQRIQVIKDILPLLGNNYILKGGTCLSLFYKLNRYSEDIDLDSMVNNMEDIYNKLQFLKKIYGTWEVSVQKNTPTTFRLSINYGGKRADLPEGRNDYRLTLEANTRYISEIRDGTFLFQNVNGINIYHPRTLCQQKLMAFSSRSKIRDFYDIGFLLRKYPQFFSNEMLTTVAVKIKEYGIDELDILLDDEIRNHNLIGEERIEGLEYYTEDTLDLITKIKIDRNPELKKIYYPDNDEEENFDDEFSMKP